VLGANDVVSVVRCQGAALPVADGSVHHLATAVHRLGQGRHVAQIAGDRLRSVAATTTANSGDLASARTWNPLNLRAGISREPR